MVQRWQHTVPQTQTLDPRRWHRHATDRPLAGRTANSSRFADRSSRPRDRPAANLLRCLGAPYPATRDHRPITPLAGKSLLPTWQAKTPVSQRTVFWEHMGNAAVRSGNWKLVRTKGKPWELYDLKTDRSELKDLAKKNSEQVKQLSDKWEIWARDVGAEAPKA